MILPFFTPYCTRLRDRFADAALSSLMFHEPETKDPKALADRSNQIAEAMMARRGKKPEPKMPSLVQWMAEQLPIKLVGDDKEAESVSTAATSGPVGHIAYIGDGMTVYLSGMPEAVVLAAELIKKAQGQ